MKLKEKLGWTGTTLSFTGVALQALLPTAFIPWTYPIFVVSASAWLANARMEHNRPNVTLQLALIGLNLIAAWRHLIQGILT